MEDNKNNAPSEAHCGQIDDVVTRATCDDGNIPWHDAGEALIKYLITANAQAEVDSLLKNLRVECESHLLASLGESAKHADLIVIRPAEVSVAGPIGEVLGICSSIEFKPETDNCTMATLIRSWVYTLLAAYRQIEETGDVPEKVSDLATLIVTYHKPISLFNNLAANGVKVRENKRYKGVYSLKGTGVQLTHFVVMRELDYAENGYEWLGWMHSKLTLEEGRALMDRWRQAGDEEKPMATQVAYVVLRANPRIMDTLIKEADTKMSDALRQVLYPLYGDELEKFERERDKAVQEKDEAVQEKNEAVQEKNEAVKLLSKLVEDISNDGVDPETVAKARRLLAASGSVS